MEVGRRRWKSPPAPSVRVALGWEVGQQRTGARSQECAAVIVPNSVLSYVQFRP